MSARWLGVAADGSRSDQVRPEDLRETIPTGPDVQPYLDAVDRAAGAGYEHIALLQIGEDQDGFFRFWQDELGQALRDRN